VIRTGMLKPLCNDRTGPDFAARSSGPSMAATAASADDTTTAT
jgi:hypothetical protein